MEFTILQLLITIQPEFQFFILLSLRLLQLFGFMVIFRKNFCKIFNFVFITGANRLSKNIYLLTGEYVNIAFIFCWKFLAPLCILLIWGLNWYLYEPVTYGNYEYPIGAQIYGWCIALISIVAIPLAACHSVVKATGKNLIEVIIN